jgi:hypothetical protein
MLPHRKPMLGLMLSMLHLDFGLRLPGASWFSADAPRGQNLQLCLMRLYDAGEEVNEERSLSDT